MTKSKWEKEKKNKIAKRMMEAIEIAKQSIKVWKEMGVKRLKIVTSGRDTVCQHCKEWDGKIIDIKDALVGKTVPPFPYCLNYEEAGCTCWFLPIPNSQKI